MCKVYSIKASWILALVMCVPGAMIMAEDPSSIREDQPPVAMGGDVVPTPEFRLFGPMPVPPKSAAMPTTAAASYGMVSTAATAGAKFMCDGASGVAYLGYGHYGIDARGATAGGFFDDTTGAGWAYVAYGDTGVLGYGSYGIEAYGTFMGGYFVDTNASGYAYLAIGESGVNGFGNTVGGFFQDLDSGGTARAGYGTTGVQGDGAYGVRGNGTTMGGYFRDSNSSGYAYVGVGNYGIEAAGNTIGGYFRDLDNSGWAFVGTGNAGITAHGDLRGGYFTDTNSSGYAYVADGDYGIRSYGYAAGGYFEDSNSSGYAYVGTGDVGIEAGGATRGGWFSDSDHSGIAQLGDGDRGVMGWGSYAGGYFDDSNNSSYTWVAIGDDGIQASGNNFGGYFGDLTTTSYARVGYSSYKIQGTGAVSFAQNHPYDQKSVIVYAAPEGDEVATYTRGTARLVGGEARVPLGETFRWVTNPDIGLTTYLTPVGDWSDLYVAERTTDELVVRSAGGAQDGSFDYIVYGLRIGFEESSIVQEKEQEAYIPSMADHRQLYQRRPDLKSYSSLERFKGMRHAAGQKAELDLSRAQALRNAIVEFDPAVHELPGRSPRMQGPSEPEEHLSVAEEGSGEAMSVELGLGESDDGVGTAVRGTHVSTTAIPMDAEGNVYARSFRPSSQDLASLLDVSEAVEPGDVLVIDRAGSGMMRRATEASDSGVIGVVAASPGVVLGMESPGRMPAERRVDGPDGEPADDEPAAGDLALRAPVAFSGVVKCKVDAGYGSVWPGDLLVTSPTPGHAMRDEAPLPGTVLGKALEALEEGTGTIRVLVMLR